MGDILRHHETQSGTGFLVPRVELKLDAYCRSSGGKCLQSDGDPSAIARLAV